MLYYYGIAVILALLNLIMLLFLSGKRVNLKLMIVFIIIALSNMGYLAQFLAQNQSEWILANKISYLGGCFMPMLFILFMAEFCKFKIGKFPKFILIAYSMFVYALILLTGYTKFYYSSVTSEIIDGVLNITRTYGIGHFFFSVILYGYVLAGVTIIIFTYVKNKSISYNNLFYLLLIEIFSIAIFLIGNIIPIKLQLMPLTYILDELILLILIMRIRIYEVDVNVLETYQSQKQYGYILFDLARRYVGSNDTAELMIKEISTWRIDKTPPENQFFNLLDNSFNQFDNKKLSFYFPQNDFFYKCSIDNLMRGKKKIGFFVEIIDDTANQNYLNLLSSYNEKLQMEVDNKTKRIQTMQEHILVGIADIVENRDNSTGGHIKRTSDIIKILLNNLQISNIYDVDEQFCNNVITSAPMHDLGKIAIDDKILRKPSKLTLEEFEIMKSHPTKSTVIIKTIFSGVDNVEFAKIATNIANYHHEKWDGSGYPKGLKGQEIPLEARIMAIADVYDALVSDRCYKKKLSFPEAKKVILDCMGSHFDPNLEKVFLMSVNDMEKYYK